MPTKYLTKTKIKLGMQCRKALYLLNHGPKVELSEAARARIYEGSEVGRKAREFFPGGKLIDSLDPLEALRLTKVEIENSQAVLFEPAFLADGALVRIDILKRSEDGWEIVEVKSSKGLSDEHVLDTAIQCYVAEGAGLQIRKISIMHLNPECRFPDLSRIFITVDVTEACRNVGGIGDKVRSLNEVMHQGQEPVVKVGLHCDEPNVCDYKKHCMSTFPSPNVFELPGIGSKKGWKLVAEGKRSIFDLKGSKQPEKVLLTIQAHELGKPIFNVAAFKAALGEWAYPHYYLDFETLGPAIPRYDGCAPYDEVPFQFSLHVQSNPNAPIVHHEYLHLESNDPRRPIAEGLIRLIGDSGAVVAFNAYVEKNIIKKLAALYPDIAAQLNSIAERCVDPLPVFRDNIFHPGFRGGYSIKDITPALIGAHLDYSVLDIKDGLQARSTAESLIKTGIQTPEDRKQRDALLRYCEQDTLAMVELIKWMRNLV